MKNKNKKIRALIIFIISVVLIFILINVFVSDKNYDDKFLKKVYDFEELNEVKNMYIGHNRYFDVVDEKYILFFDKDSDDNFKNLYVNFKKSKFDEKYCVYLNNIKSKSRVYFKIKDSCYYFNKVDDEIDFSKLYDFDKKIVESSINTSLSDLYEDNIYNDVDDDILLENKVRVLRASGKFNIYYLDNKIGEFDDVEYYRFNDKLIFYVFDGDDELVLEFVV